VDVFVGKVAEGVVGKLLKNTKTIKTLQVEVNTQKNIARGKSNTIPKRKADVKGAQKRLDNYRAKRVFAASTVASGIGTETIKQVEKYNAQKKE
jgi:hypothetical protein